jgi:hypothetical protein
MYKIRQKKREEKKEEKHWYSPAAETIPRVHPIPATFFTTSCALVHCCAPSACPNRDCAAMARESARREDASHNWKQIWWVAPISATPVCAAREEARVKVPIVAIVLRINKPVGRRKEAAEERASRRAGAEVATAPCCSKRRRR